MNTITSVIKRHLFVTLFALAFAISWGSYYILSGPFLFPFGSILAALMVSSVTGGRNGLKDLAGRCLRWNVGLKWYAAALFASAFIGLAMVSINVLFGGQIFPWKLSELAPAGARTATAAKLAHSGYYHHSLDSRVYCHYILSFRS